MLTFLWGGLYMDGVGPGCRRHGGRGGHTHRTTWPHGSHFGGIRGHSMAAAGARSEKSLRCGTIHLVDFSLGAEQRQAFN